MHPHRAAVARIAHANWLRKKLKKWIEPVGVRSHHNNLFGVCLPHKMLVYNIADACLVTSAAFLFGFKWLQKRVSQWISSIGVKLLPAQISNSIRWQFEKASISVRCLVARLAPGSQVAFDNDRSVCENLCFCALGPLKLKTGHRLQSADVRRRNVFDHNAFWCESHLANEVLGLLGCARCLAHAV